MVFMRRVGCALVLVAVAMLTAAVTGVAVDCPSGAIAHDSDTVQIGGGRVRVDVCVTLDSETGGYIFTYLVSNIDSGGSGCGIASFGVPKAETVEAVQENSLGWATTIESGCWTWDGPDNQLCQLALAIIAQLRPFSL